MERRVDGETEGVYPAFWIACSARGRRGILVSRAAALGVSTFCRQAEGLVGMSGAGGDGWNRTRSLALSLQL